MRPHVSEQPHGRFKVWEKPKTRGRYVIGADVAENRIRDRNRQVRKVVVQFTDDRPDYSAACVLEVDSGRNVASWWGHIDPDEYAVVLAAMGFYYNDAVIVAEKNSSGVGVVDSLVKVLRYPNIYRSKVWAAESDDPVTANYGWRTDPSTRPLLIQRLHEAFNSGMARTWDMDLINELRTMQFDDGGIARAMGKHKDDRVLAYAMALQGRYELLYGSISEAEEDKRRGRLSGYERKVWDRIEQQQAASERRKHRGNRLGSGRPRKPVLSGRGDGVRRSFQRGPRP